MPLGLHHLIGGDHYAPMPENPDPRRADWSAIYYHRARSRRPSASIARRVAATRSGSTGRPGGSSGRIRQTTPEALLLWFHRLPWTYRMASGRTLWDEIVAHYTRGAEGAAGVRADVAVPRRPGGRGATRRGRREAAPAGDRRRRLARQVRRLLPPVRRTTVGTRLRRLTGSRRTALERPARQVSDRPSRALA